MSSSFRAAARGKDVIALRRLDLLSARLCQRDERAERGGVERRHVRDGDRCRLLLQHPTRDPRRRRSRPAIVRALEEGDDEKVEIAAEPAQEPAPEPSPDEALDEEPVVVKPPPKPKASIATADLVIYVLASVVFAVSVLGLIWLLRS
jgi:hypothetical protein